VVVDVSVVGGAASLASALPLVAALGEEAEVAPVEPAWERVASLDVAGEAVVLPVLARETPNRREPLGQARRSSSSRSALSPRGRLQDVVQHAPFTPVH
jgi:hypothetical protein